MVAKAAALCVVVVVAVALVAGGVRATEAVSPVEADVLKWLNIARTDPATMAAQLQAMLPNFDASNPMLYHIPGDDVGLITNEGPAAVNEAIKTLQDLAAAKTANPSSALPALSFANGLIDSSQDHAQDQGSNGVFSHTGTDGSTPWDRINRYGTWKVTAAENMASGWNTGVDIVAQLLIDDGEPDRGHRKNILNGALLRVGTAVRPHTIYQWVCVQDFAGQFTDNANIRTP